MHLDYSIKDSQGRKDFVNSILTDDTSEQYLSYMADYLLFTADKNQTKIEQHEEYPIITRNREATTSKRQISFDEIIELHDQGEDTVHALISNDKNQIMDPKTPITAQDMAEIPTLKETIRIIDDLNTKLPYADTKSKYSLKKQIIEMWKQAYIIRDSYRTNIGKTKPNARKSYSTISIEENITFDEEGYPVSDSPISFLSTDKVSYLLTNFLDLSMECGEDLNSDIHFVLLDLQDLINRALKDEPLYIDVMTLKMQHYTNAEIKDFIFNKYSINHTEQYISTLWKQRIPKLICEKAQEEYLLWYYTNVEKGNWKTCRKCGETKLAHPLFFSRNTSSKDNFYSVCKCCRRKGGK